MILGADEEGSSPRGEDDEASDSRARALDEALGAWLDLSADASVDLEEFLRAYPGSLRVEIRQAIEHLRLVAPGLSGAPGHAGLAPGERLGDHVIEAPIGRGGMGIVYRARQTRLDRLVALKVMADLAPPGEEERRRFEREARIVASLVHPGIVRVHDFGEAEGRLYFTMDLLTGGTLKSRLAELARDPMSAVEVVRDVARAVAFAHRAGVLHRDLKPSNILFDADDRPIVTDFGLARRMQSESISGSSGGLAVGTLAYMAPDVAARGSSVASPRSDVWSLGVVLYEALTGRRPFEGASPERIAHALAREAPISPRTLRPTISRECEVVCLRCLSKRPEGRYRSATELADDLDRLLESTPPLAVARGASIRRNLARRGSGLPFARSLLVATVVVGVLGLALFSRSRWRRDGSDDRDSATRADPMIVTPPPNSTAERVGRVVVWPLERDLWASESSTPDTLDLEPLIAPGETGPELRFVSESPGGIERFAASLGAGTGLRVRAPFEPEERRERLDMYTILFDLRVERPSSDGRDTSGAGDWIPLLETDAADPWTSDAEIRVRDDGVIAAEGLLAPGLRPDVWQRVAIVADLPTGRVEVWVEGELALRIDGLDYDGRFSLSALPRESGVSFALVPGRRSGRSVSLRGLQLRDHALSATQVADLGRAGERDATLEALRVEDTRRPAAEFAILDGPRAMNVEAEAVDIVWTTTHPADSSVEVTRASGATETRHIELRGLRRHQARLGPFDPGEQVTVRVTSRTEVSTATETRRFRASPPAGRSLSCLVGGGRDGLERARQVSETRRPETRGPETRRPETRRPEGAPWDLVAWIGDVELSNQRSARAAGGLGAALRRSLLGEDDSLPVLVAPGPVGSVAEWLPRAGWTPSASGVRATSIGCARVLVLDTARVLGDAAESIAPIESELLSRATREARWRIVLQHRSPFADIRDDRSAEWRIAARVRDELAVLYAAAGVDLVITADERDPEVSVRRTREENREVTWLSLGADTRGSFARLDVSEERLSAEIVDPPARVDLEPIPLGEREKSIHSILARSPTARASSWRFSGTSLEEAHFADQGPGRLELAVLDDSLPEAMPRFATTQEFGIAALPGAEGASDVGGERVMWVPRALTSSYGLRVRHDATVSKPSSFTLVFDLLIPASSFEAGGYLALVNTNPWGWDDSELYLRLPAGTFGLQKGSRQCIFPDVWHRIAIVIEFGSRERRDPCLCVDGVLVPSQPPNRQNTGWILRSRYDESPWFLLFNDENGESAPLFIASFLFAPHAISDEQAKRLGKASAAGIQLPAP